MSKHFFSLAVLSLLACSGGESLSNSELSTLANAEHTNQIKHVFVVMMENQDTNTVYANDRAPYLNALMKKYAYATAYGDDLQTPDLPSEPHYIQIEAGTNSFADHTFTRDSDPSASNSTASTDHLVTQLASVPGATWMSYQEDMPDPCPVASSFPYAAKHNPFVFFQDVSFTNGKPDRNNTFCASHHRDFTSLTDDLKAGTVASYNFITPNQCNNMHGDVRCSNGCRLAITGYGPCISAGDQWLQTNLPPVIDYALANQGLVLIVWDEAEDTPYEPFLLIGNNLRATGANSTPFSHASFLKSLQQILNVPTSANVAAANDFGSFFQDGAFP